VLPAGCGGDASSKKGPDTSNDTIPSGRESPPSPQEAAASRHPPEEIRKSQDNLKKIGAALLGKFEGACPAGFADRKRKPILSWRVAILPRLGHDELFKRFNLLEPWDSPTNSKLLAEMPDVFRPVKGSAKPGYTYYQGFVGPDAMFPAVSDTGLPVNPTVPKDYHSRSFGHVIDGLSYTLLIVEGGEAVPWTRPDELVYDPKKPLPRLGGLFDGDFNACFCDGSVHLIPRTAPEKLVRALITPAGQERVDLREIGLSDPIAGPPGGTPKTPRLTRTNLRGMITYKGLPLRGGTVTYRAADGKDYTTGIAADGTYTLPGVPAGPMAVSVETESVKNVPGGGKYVPIPQKYSRPDYSGLRCEVQGGEAQTFNINLD
jgi:hypothetical protein